MAALDLPAPDQVRPFVGGILGALSTPSNSPTDLQRRILGALIGFTTPDPVDIARFEAWPAEAVYQALPEEADRAQLAHFAVVLELTMHPLPPEVERHVESYLSDLGVGTPYVEVCRDTAQSHLALLHADLIRNSWTTEQTVRGIFHGHLLRLARSKAAYYGVGHDRAIASRWRSLGDCRPGTWGREVFEFYGERGFPFPGEKHGIYEVGARHDWIHVLCDYDTDPEGEIDVFAFIAATMDDPRGLIQFLFTLALFQNASVSTVGGKKVVIARADTLADEGAPEHLADSLWRASQCRLDVMGGIDPFEWKDEPLDGLRETWNIPAKRSTEGRPPG